MSNRKLIDPSIVTGIADAIRTKKGTTATIKVSELADEIASIPTGGMADSTKELVNVVSGVTPTDEISLNNGIASGVVDAPSVQSWSGTRTTADGGTIKDGIAYIKAIRGKSVVVDGNVLNCKQKSVSSYGRNIFNEETELGNLYPSGDSIGMERASATQIRSKYIACKPSQKYYVTTSDTIFIFCYDASKNYIAAPIASGDTLAGGAYRYDTANHGCGIFTTPSGCAYIRFYAVASYGTTYKNDICFEEGNTSHGYAPYFTDTLTLPTLTAFPHGLCGVGTAYDEVDLAEGKATKRIGCVDLGTLTWVNSDVYGYTLQVPNHKRGGQFLWIKPKDAIFGAQFNTGNDGFVIQYPSGTYADNAALKADMSGVMLYYELATEEQSTFTPQRAYYKASNNGQETATADTATAPFTAEIGYKEPTATELVNALNG